MDRDVHPAEAVLLKHHLGHALSVDLGVHGRFGEKHLLSLGIDLELLVKGVVP